VKTTSRLFTLMLVVVCSTNFLYAQVNWDNSSFKKLIKKAAAQNKLVMLDFYTDWCIPCKQVEKIIFTDDTLIVNVVNNNYIASRLNAEKGEGKVLAKKYSVSGYPTLLFLDKDKNIIGRVVGTRSNDVYLEAIKTAGKSEQK
jgi:thiol:disulfide interchange protein